MVLLAISNLSMLEAVRNLVAAEINVSETPCTVGFVGQRV